MYSVNVAATNVKQLRYCKLPDAEEAMVERVMSKAVEPHALVNRFGVKLVGKEQASWYSADGNSVVSYDIVEGVPVRENIDVWTRQPPYYLNQPDDFNVQMFTRPSRVASRVRRLTCDNPDADRPYVTRAVCLCCGDVVSLSNCNYEDFGITRHSRECYDAVFAIYPLRVAQQIIFRMRREGLREQRRLRRMQDLPGKYKIEAEEPTALSATSTAASTAALTAASTAASAAAAAAAVSELADISNVPPIVSVDAMAVDAVPVSMAMPPMLAPMNV